MSQFKTSLVMEAVEGGFILSQELIYHSSLLGRDIIVPKDFFTDLASVPFFARWLVPVSTGKHRKAAVLHDFLCYPQNRKPYAIGQSQADAIFKEALEVVGLPVHKRYALWVPVRVYQGFKDIFR